MIRTLLGVVLSGTVLLGWCWYYSDHLPRHLQQAKLINPPQQADGTEVAEPVDEEGATPVSLVKDGPLAFSFQNQETGGLDWRAMGIGLGGFVGVALLASLLLMAAGLRSYIARVGFVFLLGVFAAVLVQMCDYLFWGQNMQLTLYKGAFFMSAALIAGLVLAMFVRPQPTLVRIPVKVR
jgi:hypothetical protein